MKLNIGPLLGKVPGSPILCEKFFISTVVILGVNRRLRYDLQRMPVWNEIMSDLKEKFNNDLNHSRLNLSRPQLLSQFGGPSQVNT